MSRKNKIITAILFGILIFVTVFLTSQKYYDNQKNMYGMNNSEINKIEINKESNNNLSEEDLNIENNLNVQLEQNLKDNQFRIYDNTKYTINDAIKLNIPSEYSICEEKENKILEVSNGIINHYEFLIESYEFNKETYTLDFTIHMYSTDLNAKTNISSDNFKVSYANEFLENLTINNYDVNSGLTKIELSFKFDDSINLKDINTTFFKFSYIDEFNVREFPLY